MFKRVVSNNKSIGKIESNHKVLFMSFRTIRLKYRYDYGRLWITEINQSIADEIKRAKMMEIDGVKYDLTGASIRYYDLWNELRIEGERIVSQLEKSRIVQGKQYNNIVKLYA